jgi:hypothetical protein
LTVGHLIFDRFLALSQSKNESSLKADPSSILCNLKKVSVVCFLPLPVAVWQGLTRWCYLAGAKFEWPADLIQRNKLQPEPMKRSLKNARPAGRRCKHVAA